MESRFSILRGRGMRITLYWLTVILVVVCDQATKAAAREVLEDGPGVLIPGVINLIHVENTGAAFSIGQGGGFFFVIVALAFLVGTLALVVRSDGMPAYLVCAIALVAGGGLGNMIDRVLDGSVTDFLATAFMDFPVFNVADICVTCGIVLSMVLWRVWDTHGEHNDEPRPAGGTAF